VPFDRTSPLAVLDGYPHTYTVNGVSYVTYTINIPRELQSAIIQGQNTLHLRIIGTQDYYGAYRLIAGGGNNGDPNYQAKFKIVYSKLN